MSHLEIRRIGSAVTGHGHKRGLFAKESRHI
jgi:hypothetical protein